MFSFVRALSKVEQEMLIPEQSGAVNAYPGGRSQATEMANLWGYIVGISNNLSLSSLGGRDTVIMAYHIRLFALIKFII